MKILIKTVKTTDLSAIKKEPIAFDNWDFGYDPKPYFKLAYLEGKGFILEIGCNEKDPKRVYKSNGESVWLDSCLEWFVNFMPEKSDIYLNIEMNANAISHFGVGSERKDRRQITSFGAEYPGIKCEIGEDGWKNTLFLPLETIEKVYGKTDFKNGYVFKSNFYKCGDETEKKHYLSWSPIGTEKPDFHRPEFFGDIEIN